MKIGGALCAGAGKATVATLIAVVDGEEITAHQAAAIAAGAKLRAYDFDSYKTRDRKSEPALKIIIGCADPAGARKAWKEFDAVTDGVILARDLVNEPPNVLGPVEFAARAKALEKLGVEVEILDDKAMRRLEHGRAARRRPGFGAAAARRRHAVERRQGRDRHRSPSSARAWSSTPAAFRSSRPAAWRT